MFLSNHKHWPQISFTIKETEKKESCHSPSHGGPDLFKSVQSNWEVFRPKKCWLLQDQRQTRGTKRQQEATRGTKRQQEAPRGNKKRWWSPTGDWLQHWNQLRFHRLRGITQPKSKGNLLILEIFITHFEIGTLLCRSTLSKDRERHLDWIWYWCANNQPSFLEVGFYWALVKL